jgi:hypothetical protein
MARYAGGGKNTVESCRALRTKCRRGAEEAFLHQVLQKDPGLADRRNHLSDLPSTSELIDGPTAQY